MFYEPFCAHLDIRIYRPTWRSTFYLTSGLCLLAMAAGFYSIPPDHVSTEVDKRVDWLGAFLVTAGLVLIVFVLSDGEIAPNQWATSCACRPFSSMTRLTVDPLTSQPFTSYFYRHHRPPSSWGRLHGPLRALATLPGTRPSRPNEPSSPSSLKMDASASSEDVYVEARKRKVRDYAAHCVR